MLRPTSIFFALTLAATLPACGGEDATTGDEQDLTAGPKLKFDEYQVLFTNPVCKRYAYDTEVVSVSGEPLEAKPENAFCTHLDSAVSGARPESPQNKLISWIKDPSTKEIFFTYLSYSNSAVTTELCNAIKERDVKVTFVLDSMSDRAKADQLLACKPKTKANAPRFEMRGHEGGIGFAHNKVFLVNPHSDKIRIAFSSGNLSSGVVLHHENWHFITLPAETHFAQAHLCMMEAELDHHSSKSEYRDFMAGCRAAIPFPEERDMKVFFSPAEGAAASKVLLEAVSRAKTIDIGAHRFSYTKLISALKGRLADEATAPGIRIITDDDTYWAGHGEITGDNQPFEFTNVESLTKMGAEAKWMETNHAEHLLHHNKFLILNMPKGKGPSAVFGGAGNLTGTAFSENWENFYYISIFAVVKVFRTQYEHMWDDLATATEDMPSENVLPPTE